MVLISDRSWGFHSAVRLGGVGRENIIDSLLSLLAASPLKVVFKNVSVSLAKFIVARCRCMLVLDLMATILKSARASLLKG